MALLLISGYPCSGKTTRSLEIKKMIESRLIDSQKLEIVLINDQHLGIHRSVYDNSQTEKVARASLFSSTIRQLSKERIVICDGMNYIKGFRYQLYCAAREAGVRMCTVHVVNLIENCLNQNKKLVEEDRYKLETMNNLISRYEEPNPAVRWDSPLIILTWCDSLLYESDSVPNRMEVGLAGKLVGLRVLDDKGDRQTIKCQPPDQVIKHASKTLDTQNDEDELSSKPDHVSVDIRSSSPWSRIANDLWKAITEGDLKPVHAAVKKPSQTSTNFLHQLEMITSMMIKNLLISIQNSSTNYGNIKFSCKLLNNNSKTDQEEEEEERYYMIKIPMGKTLNISVLQRLKRQFTTLNKQIKSIGQDNDNDNNNNVNDDNQDHVLNDPNQIALNFLKYIQGAL